MQIINTEFGEIPNTWDVKKVKDIGRVVTGKTPPTKDPDFYGKEFLFVRIPDMGRNVRIKESSVMLSKKGAECISSSRLPPDSVMVSCIATIGNIGITSQDCFTNQQINTVIPNTNVILPEWIYYFFKLHTNYLESLGGGGSVYTNISKGKFENALIAVPPLSEQRAVVKILGDLDAKIELNQQMNKTLEAMAQSLFKEWFVDFRFPGHEKVKFVDGLPEGWRRCALSDISTLSAGGDRPEVVSEKPSSVCTVPIYSNGIDNDGLYGYTNLAKIFDESVTVSARGTIGFTCLRQTPYFPIVRLVSLVPDTKHLSATYLYLWLKSIDISGTGTTQQQLTVPDFRKTEILIPTSEIMKRFTLVANSIFTKITANKNEISDVGAIRDSLLPRLMSGRVKVS